MSNGSRNIENTSESASRPPTFRPTALQAENGLRRGVSILILPIRKKKTARKRSFLLSYAPRNVT